MSILIVKSTSNFRVTTAFSSVYILPFFHFFFPYYIFTYYLPSSSPTQIVFPTPVELWGLVLASSEGVGSGTYSKHLTGAPIWRDFTGRGVDLFKEKMSTWPWVESPPPATCKNRARTLLLQVVIQPKPLSHPWLYRQRKKIIKEGNSFRFFCHFQPLPRHCAFTSSAENHMEKISNGRKCFHFLCILMLSSPVMLFLSISR